MVQVLVWQRHASEDLHHTMIRCTRALEVVTDAVLGGARAGQTAAMQELPGSRRPPQARPKRQARQLNRVLYEIGGKRSPAP